MCLDNIFFLNVVFLLGRLKKYNKMIFLQKSRLTPKLNIDTKVITCVRNFNSNLYNSEWLTVVFNASKSVKPKRVYIHYTLHQ